MKSYEKKAAKVHKTLRDCIAVLERFDERTLAELLRVNEEPYGPDGWPTSSPGPSAAALKYPPRGELRTTPEAPLKPKKEHGYATSGVLAAVQARLSDVCEPCQGRGNVMHDEKFATCRRCQGTGKRWADPIGEAVERIFALFGEMARELALADKRRQVVVFAAEGVRGRQSSLQGTCRCCGATVSGVGEDRLRKGLDRACYLSWDSWKLRNSLAGFQSDPARQFQAFLEWRKRRVDASAAEAADDWRVGEIDRLRERGELPVQ